MKEDRELSIALRSKLKENLFPCLLDIIIELQFLNFGFEFKVNDNKYWFDISDNGYITIQKIENDIFLNILNVTIDGFYIQEISNGLSGSTNYITGTTFYPDMLNLIQLSELTKVILDKIKYLNKEIVKVKQTIKDVEKFFGIRYKKELLIEKI